MLNTLPLPLAQVLRRSLNAKSSTDRHHLAYFAGEAALKLAAAARIGVVLGHGLEPGSAEARQLESLALPSTGHWLALLRGLSAHLAGRPDAGLLPLADLDGELSARRPEWTAVDAFLTAAAEASAISNGVAREARTGGLLGLFTALVAYRNEVMGHGAQRLPAYYDQMGDLLLAALGEILACPALLGGLELAVARLAIAEDGQEATLSWQMLVGLGSLARELDEPEADRGCVPGRVYLVGPGIRVPLHPMVVFQEDDLGRERVGFLNRTVRRGKGDTVRRVDYLDYAAGEALSGIDAREAMAELLSNIRGTEVSVGDVEATAAGLDSGADSVADELTQGATIGDYLLEGELGRGGMGIVYRARQRSLNRVVALKVLPPALAADPVTVARFRREVAALARCDHPNVVKILATGVDGDRYWYAMELVDGVDLSSVYEVLSTWERSDVDLTGGHLAAAVTSSAEMSTRRRALVESQAEAASRGEELPEVETVVGPPPEIEASGPSFCRRLAGLMAGACHGVQHLHEHGIVHRDLKPGNLMLTRDGQRVVVMDLGLAQISDASTRLTRTSTHLLGTLRYMAPEQLQRSLLEVDHRADVYALGATLYELACLQPVYGGGTEQELIRQKLQDEPVEPEKVNPETPEDLAAVIEMAVQRKPEDRYGSAEGLAEDLEAVAESRGVRARRFGRFHYLRLFLERNRGLARAIVAFVLLSLVLSTGAAWWNLRERRRTDLALARAEKENYRSAISLARNDIAESHFLRAMDRLRSAPPQHRNLEWGLLVLEASQDLLAVHLPVDFVFSYQLVLCAVPSENMLVAAVKTLEGNVVVIRIDRTTGTADEPVYVGSGFPLGLACPSREQCVLSYIDHDHDRLVFTAIGDENMSCEIPVDGSPDVALHPRGRFAAIAEESGPLEIWDIQSCTQDWSETRSGISSGGALAFDPSGEFLVSSISAGEIRLYEIETHAVKRSMPFNGYGTVDISSGLDRILVNSRGDLRLMDTRTGETIANFEVAGTRAEGGFTPSGDVWTGNGERIILQEVDTGTAAVRTVLEGQNPVFFDDGLVATWRTSERMVASGFGEPWEIAIWDQWSTSKTILKGLPVPLLEGSISSDGKHVVAGNGSEIVAVDTASGDLLWSVEPRFKDGSHRLFSLDFSGDDQFIVVGSIGGVLVHDAQSGNELASLECTDCAGEAMLDPTGRMAAMAGRDGTTRVWDWRSGALVSSLTATEDGNSRVQTAAFTPDGATLLTADTSSVIAQWDVASGRLIRTLAKFPHRYSGARSLVVSGDGRFIAATDCDPERRCCLWNASGELIRKIAGPYGLLDITNDGQRLLTYNKNVSSVLVIDQFGEELLEIPGPSDYVRFFGLSRDGRVVFVGSTDGRIAIASTLPWRFDNMEFLDREISQMKEERRRNRITTHSQVQIPASQGE